MTSYVGLKSVYCIRSTKTCNDDCNNGITIHLASSTCSAMLPSGESNWLAELKRSCFLLPATTFLLGQLQRSHFVSTQHGKHPWQQPSYSTLPVRLLDTFLENVIEHCFNSILTTGGYHVSHTCSLGFFLPSISCLLSMFKRYKISSQVAVPARWSIGLTNCSYLHPLLK